MNNISENTYPNHELLIETDRLSRHLEDEDIRIVDLRQRKKYDTAHIQNAVFLNYSDITGESAEDRPFPPRNSSVILGILGIDRDTTVVAYDDDSGHYAARLFWVLEYLGHKKSRILNGGFTKWINEKKEVTVSPHRPDAKTFLPQPQPSRIAASQWILKHISDPDVVILDVRRPEEYSGREVRAMRGGRIPGSINIEWRESMLEDQTFKTSQELTEMFNKAGVCKDKDIIIYCQLGVRAAHTYFTLRLLGYPRLRVFNGSWAEWGNDSKLPIEEK